MLSHMTAKKFTRGFFYVLGIAAAFALLYLILEFFLRRWSELYPVAIGLALTVVVIAFIRLAAWAFTPDPVYNYKNPPYGWTAPDYTLEGAYCLSDGRRCIPHYNGGKFTGNFPEDPYIGETVGDYTWGKHSSGSWVWLHKDGSK